MSAGIMQKLLDSLKYATLDEENASTSKKAISILLKHFATADVMRSISLFITSALQKASLEDRPDVRQDQADELVIGSLVLHAFTDFLCIASPVGGAEKFAKTVTNKVGTFFSLLSSLSSPLLSSSSFSSSSSLPPLKLPANSLRHFSGALFRRFQESSLEQVR